MCYYTIIRIFDTREVVIFVVRYFEVISWLFEWLYKPWMFMENLNV